MIITENTNLNGTLEVTNSEGVKKSVVSINSNLTQNSNNFSLNFTIMDAVSVGANITEVQNQMDTFMSQLKAKMVELGYKITI
jgi:hypothetical protein